MYVGQILYSVVPHPQTSYDYENLRIKMAKNKFNFKKNVFVYIS